MLRKGATCSKKVAASSVWASADTLDGEGGASSNSAAFLPYYLQRHAQNYCQV